MLVLKTLLPPEIPPSDRIVALHDQLRPHIRRAAEIHRLDHARRAALQAAESVLDGLSVAVILARCRDSRITHMNRAAARLEAAEDGITTDDAGRLIAGDPGSTATLRRAIEACDTSIRTATDRPSIAMCLPRPSGAPDLHLLVTPAPKDTDMVLSQPTATVLITDPSHPPTLCLPHLIELHGLTTTEARVAAALARGASIKETAHDLAIADATVRHHLKQAFAKTGTHRQADLVRLILADPLMYCGGSD